MPDDIMMGVTHAEAELLEYVRGVALTRFAVTLTHLDGAWTVKRTDIEAGQFNEAHAGSFDEAWRGARPRHRFTVVE